MAVMPSISYTADTSSMTPVAPHYSSKFMDTNSSGLDPNASVYQPLKKWTLRPSPTPTLCLPAFYLKGFFFCLFVLWPRQAHHFPVGSAHLRLRTFFLFPSPDQKDVVLYDSVVVKTEKKTEKTQLEMGIASTRESQYVFFFLNVKWNLTESGIYLHLSGFAVFATTSCSHLEPVTCSLALGMTWFITLASFFPPSH